MSYNYIDTGKAPIKAWTKGVFVEEEAVKQLTNIASMPFIHKHVAAMPDVHVGKGATVGSVIATKGAIIPAAVGVDIGCGMMAVRTSLRADDLPDSLSVLRSEIERSIPHGRSDNGGPNDIGAWRKVPENVSRAYARLSTRLGLILDKHPKAATRNDPARHLGTLGTGNHFVEVCLDTDNNVWAMLHSGSRGIGNRIGSYFIERAKEEMRRWHIDKYLPDMDLAYLVENTELFNDYVAAVSWAQEFAATNRLLMMDEALAALDRVLGRTIVGTAVAINCHHNYVTMERHFGANVLVTRKGAVMARKDVLGIIPGSMGTRSYIVRGKGNPESFCSCSHGAGRSMSRAEARRRFTVDDHAKATAHVECRKDEGVLDETPGAYKPIDAVMEAQSDLVEIVTELRQVLCVKG